MYSLSFLSCCVRLYAGKKYTSLAQKKKIESLEINLERSRNSLEVYEQQQSELQHRLTSLELSLEHSDNATKL